MNERSAEAKLEDIIELVERADMIVLHFGEKKAALGRDIQVAIVSALRAAAVVSKAVGMKIK